MNQVTLHQTQHQAPKETDAKVLASLPPLVRQSLDAQINFDFELTGFKIRGNPPREALRAALQVIERFLTPLPPTELSVALARLFVMTQKRAEDETTNEFMIEVFMRELEQYPADIVAKVLHDWPKKSKWWPAWHELKTEIDHHNERQKIHDAITKYLYKHPYQ